MDEGGVLGHVADPAAVTEDEINALMMFAARDSTSRPRPRKHQPFTFSELLPDPAFNITEEDDTVPTPPPPSTRGSHLPPQNLFLRSHRSLDPKRSAQEPVSPSPNDIDAILAAALCGHLLTAACVEALCARATDLLTLSPNLENVSSPCTIVGDLHGQFYDLVQLLRGGLAPQTRYVFLGDYVDRGAFSCETFVLLLAMRVRWPEHVILLRGNHESRTITLVYGFYDECVRKYGSASVWRMCCSVFDLLPLAAVVDDNMLCVHGGLSPLVAYVDEVLCLDRQVEVPHEGVMCDLLWSDPDDGVSGWNGSPRGAGFLFGGDVTHTFLVQNDLQCLVRAHQLAIEGYREWFGGEVMTVWSAPNYCYRCQNDGAVLCVGDNGERVVRRFSAMPEVCCIVMCFCGRGHRGHDGGCGGGDGGLGSVVNSVMVDSLLWLHVSWRHLVLWL